MFDIEEPATPAWWPCDGWFAAALATCAQPASLATVMSAGDAINRSVFSESEILHAVSLMKGTGLLEVTGAPNEPRFALTPSGRSLLDRRRGGLVGQVASCQRLLKALDPRASSVQLPAGFARSAYLEYRSWVSARLAQ